MTSIAWKDQYKHPEWQKKRLECLEAANWECQECGAKEDELHVHHPRYVKGRMVWEYPVTELAVLCESCHKAAHSLLDEIKYELAMSSSSTVWAALGYVRAFSSYFANGIPMQVENYEVATGIASVYRIPPEDVIAMVKEGLVISDDVATFSINYHRPEK